MPLAKIHVVEGRYDEARIAKVSAAIQAALMNTLRVPPDDFYQLIFDLSKNRFLHTSSFVGMHYTDDLIILDVSFIQGRPKETRLALLKHINTRIATAAGVSPDDLMITLYEVPGENISFGRGEAQRAQAVAHAGKSYQALIVRSPTREKTMSEQAVKQIVLASRPTGLPTRENFRLEKVPMPELPQGGLLLRVLYLSLDPYMRGRMDDRRSYAKPVGLDEVMTGESVCEVIASDQAGCAAGGARLWATARAAAPG